MDFDMVHEFLKAYMPGAIALIFGGTGIVLCARIMYFAHAARHWPTTLGIIRRAELVWSRSPDTEHGGVWMPAIEYDYEVNGLLYTGKKISPVADTGYSIKEWSQAKIAPYAIGDSVQVHFDPVDPNRACLDITTDGLLIASILILIGVGFGVAQGFSSFG